MAVKLGLLAMLEAKPGRGDDLARFLESGRALAVAEEGTVTWYAFKISDTSYGIFDTFETEDGRQAHLGWVRAPVVPETVSQALGLHLLRFVMMADVLPEDEVVRFLASLRAALAGFVTALEQVSAGPDLGENLAARLAVEHGLAVHRASLAWAEQAITTLAGRTAASATPRSGS